MFSVGQQVECVNVSGMRPKPGTDAVNLRKGAIYTVAAVVEHPKLGVRITLWEVDPTPPRGFSWQGFYPWRFRPLTKTDISIFTDMTKIRELEDA